MAKGLTMPVGVDKSGGADLGQDNSHFDTILRLALSPGDDDNPFQNLGLDQRIIFALNDPAAQGLARQSIETIFRKYSSRAKLDTRNPITFSKNEEGVLEVKFGYVDLDTNEVKEFTSEIG